MLGRTACGVCHEDWGLENPETMSNVVKSRDNCGAGDAEAVKTVKLDAGCGKEQKVRKLGGLCFPSSL